MATNGIPGLPWTYSVNNDEDDAVAGWTGRYPEPYEPRGPLTIVEHLLFAFLLVAVLAGSAWLAIYANGGTR